MAPKPSTRPRSAAQPNEVGFLLTTGHLVALVVSAVLLSQSHLLERSLTAKEQQWTPQPPQQEVSNHGYEKFFKKLDEAERAGDEGAVKKSEPYAPNSSPQIEAMGALTCGSRSQSRCSSCSNSRCNWLKLGYDTSMRGSRARRESDIEIGKSISQLRMRLTNTAKESEGQVLDEKSLDFADEEIKKAYQHALKLERAAAKRVAEIAEAARTMQIERKRAAETEKCVPMEEDTKTPVTMEQHAEVKQLLAEWRRRQKSEPTWTDQKRKRRRRKKRSLRTGVSSVPDTRKILFQNVTFFGHKARTWLLSDQMDYDIMGAAEHRLDVPSAAEGALATGGVPFDLDTCQSNRTWRNQVVGTLRNL